MECLARFEVHCRCDRMYLVSASPCQTVGMLAQAVQMKRRAPFRSGGKWQRLLYAQATRQPVGPLQDGPSGLLDGDPEVDVLLELWALGQISGPTLQQIGQAANAAAPRPQIQTLSRLGGGGDNPGSIHRDLERKLRLGANPLPPPLCVDLPLWDAASHPPARVTRNYGVALPHELIACLFSDFRPFFDKYILGEEPLEAFWSHIPEDDVRLLGHPVTMAADWRSRAIPLRLHGDAVPVGKAKRRSLDTLSVSSLTASPGRSLNTRLLMFAIIDSAKFKGLGDEEGTMDVVWRVLLWSMGCLVKGRWPTRDWNDEPFPEDSWRSGKSGPLCGEYIFPMFQIAADLDYLCNYLKLNHFNSATTPCFKCRADRGQCPWSDLRPDAEWRRTLIGPVDWQFSPKHEVFSEPRVGLSLFHIALDVLHILDLGVCQHVAGSILHILAFDADLRGDLDSRLDMIWSKMHLAYRALGTPAGEQVPHTTFPRRVRGQP